MRRKPRSLSDCNWRGVDRHVGRRENERQRHRAVASKKRTRAAAPSSHFPILATVALPCSRRSLYMTAASDVVRPVVRPR